MSWEYIILNKKIYVYEYGKRQKTMVYLKNKVTTKKFLKIFNWLQLYFID